MSGQQSGSSKKSEAKASDKSRSMEEPSLCKNESSMYDSGRTDSGFLSGANLLSGTLVSGEIISSSSSPPPTSSKQDLDLDKSHSKSYSRLDSGVDVGLSDQLSELCLDAEEDEENTRSDRMLLSRLDVDIDSTSLSEPHKSSPQLSSSNTVSSIPWETHFQQYDFGDTHLHLAIIHGLIDVAFYLIRLVPKSSYLDIRNDDRQTALHLAVLGGQAKLVRRLVCSGANTRLVDNEGQSPLHLAVVGGDFPCLEALTRPVIPAEVEAAQLRYPAPVIHSPDPNAFNYEGLKPVHLALRGGHIGILMYLVKNVGADINGREGKSGYSCLHMACELGNESLAHILLELGADHTLWNYRRETPFGVSRCQPALQRLLLAKGAFFEVFSDSEEDEGDDEEESSPQMYAFRDLHLNGFVKVTAA